MRCPACGDTLEVANRFVQFAVCSTCDSSLVVDETAARLTGKMGALAAPCGPLSLGATGTLGGQGFRVLGRVRYGYPQGFWDEWYLQLSSGDLVWISEDEDRLELEVLSSVPPIPFRHDETLAGDQVRVAGRTYLVEEKGVATCEGGQGQLPFPILPGEQTPFLDLVDGAEVATLEFPAQGNPRLFAGQVLDRRELVVEAPEEGAGAWGVTPGAPGSRQRHQLGSDQAQSLDIDCDACGAPLEIPARGSESVTCEYCDHRLDLSLERKRCQACGKTVPFRTGSEAATCPHCQAFLRVDTDTTQLLAELRGKHRPNFPLEPGMQGQLRGAAVEVTGILRYVEREGGRTYSSTEYFLRKSDGGILWLVRDDDGWWFKFPSPERPSVDVRRLREGASFRLGDGLWRVTEVGNAGAEVLDWVEGEFTWVPRIGDSAAYVDAVRGGEKLTAEWTDQELEWNRSQPVPQEEVFRAFGIESRSAPPAFQTSYRDEPAFDLGKIFWALLPPLIPILLLTGLVYLLPRPKFPSMSIRGGTYGRSRRGYSSSFGSGGFSFGK